VPQSAKTFRFKTQQGLALAFRRWASRAEVKTPADVAGATPAEQHMLGALGGIAAAVAGDRCSTWPEPIRRWATEAPAVPDEFKDAVCLALGGYEDPFSALYEASISSANRRKLGTVFTPRQLVEHMLALSAKELSTHPALVVDPGAGVGAFTVAAARRWPSARIVAVDVNVVTLGLLAARIAFEIDADLTSAPALHAIELVHGDYLDEVGKLFSSEPERPILTLGNPPYTRVQSLPRPVREKAAMLCDGIIDSGHANLASLFQAATLTHMRDQDVSCMVLPGSFSYTRASRGLRSALWDSDRLVEVRRTLAATRAFTGRSVQASVVLVGAVRKRRPTLRLARIELDGDAVRIIDSWTQSRLDAEPANWFWTANRTGVEDSVPLSEIAIVRRGVATGSNKMFFLTDHDASVIPKELRVAAILSLRKFEDKILDEKTLALHGGSAGRRWLLAIPADYRLSGFVREYVRRHETDVSRRHLPSQRVPWYSIRELPRPQLLISPLSKTAFKVVENAVGAVPSNNLFGISLRNGADPRRLAEWLRSEAGQQELRRVSRRYQGGSHKLEPGSLRAVHVPKKLQFA
jgi:adenine-specific DNA-methyltransferase